jgi:hypothetical protein
MLIQSEHLGPWARRRARTPMTSAICSGAILSHAGFVAKEPADRPAVRVAAGPARVHIVAQRRVSVN